MGCKYFILTGSENKDMYLVLRYNTTKKLWIPQKQTTESSDSRHWRDWNTLILAMCSKKRRKKPCS